MEKIQNKMFMIFVVPFAVSITCRLAAWEVIQLKWTIKSHSIAVVVTVLEYHSSY